MKQYSYTRPREKLRDAGVKALTNVELLQVIIGSGSQKVSAARIAKNIGQLLDTDIQKVTYEELTRLPGMGHAKTCQVIAAIELGRRTLRARSSQGLKHDFTRLEASTKRLLYYTTHDGSGKRINSQLESAADTTKALLSVRKMFAQALRDGTQSLIVGIGARNQATDYIDDAVLGILKKIFETADLLEIRLECIWLVNKDTRRAFHRGALS